jgi:hypothetical protein
MPAIMPGKDIGLAFDMHGCPNRRAGLVALYEADE